ncbi:MAG: DNA translocase FtsK 4TM domain-containing protein [Phycisphaeraceae bacterium]|nr:DNA translocase FtsK 4TM domain-containing protein [Phycisphaeraceae bacterium]
MAKKRKAVKDINPRQIAPYLVWICFAGAWLLLAAAFFSYAPSDPPGPHMVIPPDAFTGKPAIENWVGKFGAVVAYRAFRMLGPGLWIGMIAYLSALVSFAVRKPVNQPILRCIGVVLMVVATSGFTHLLAQGRPGLADPGLVAYFVVNELLPRFAMLGTVLVLLVSFWVGALLAADRFILAAGAILTGRLLHPVQWRARGLALAGAAGGFLRPSASVADKDSPARKRRGRRNDDMEHIDEDAGGLGATEPFNPDQNTITLAADDDDDDDAAVVDAELDDPDAPEKESGKTLDTDGDLPGASGGASGGDAPGAYIAQRKFDPEALRAKIKQLPINFTAKSKPSDASAFAAARPVDLSGYQFPSLDLLFDPEHSFSAEMESLVREQAVLLESALTQYRIQGEVVGIDSGPVITLYEVRLAPGTKVAQVARVASDLARALKAHNLRIVPNTAGKDTVGFEVPNLKKEKVRLKELMTAQPETSKAMQLPMYLGKDASGSALIQDLTTMPHILIAGTTGSGKSVCMNSIISSFLYTKRPDELKLVLVDPKMVEMSLFRDIPHLMCPVVTEMSKAAAILEWATTKMDERYELLAEAGVRDVAGYNALSWEDLKERFSPTSEAEEAHIPKKLPYLVFVIDELADLIMTNKETEGFIVRLAQKARAVGIHLILATQRPQANVVTGLIKGNMPCRISFKVASGLDSRIVLDQKGAELLLGHGDMLFLSPRSSKLIRAQGTLVEDPEIRRVVKFLKNVATQSFEPQLIQLRGVDASNPDEEFTDERDPLFNDAVRIVLETRRGSVSLLQRRLAIGYTRSSRLIEQIAQAGLIGEHKGSQAREVTMTLEEWDALQAQAEADAQAAAQATDNAPTDDADSSDDDQDDDGSVPDEFDDEYRH